MQGLKILTVNAVFKIVVFGLSNLNRKSIVKQQVSKKYYFSYPCGMYFDVINHELTLNSESFNIKFQMWHIDVPWDITEKRRGFMESSLAHYLRGATAIILLFDGAVPESFLHIRNFYRRIQHLIRAPIFLCSVFDDSHLLRTPFNVIQDFCDEIGCKGYHELSDRYQGSITMMIDDLGEELVSVHFNVPRSSVPRFEMLGLAEDGNPFISRRKEKKISNFIRESLAFLNNAVLE